jgi:hypothetical protein
MAVAAVPSAACGDRELRRETKRLAIEGLEVDLLFDDTAGTSRFTNRASAA